MRIAGRTPDIKSQILEKEGYAYSFDRRIYVNLSARKAFSFQFIDDNKEDELQKCISEKTGGAGWQFYFSPSSLRLMRSGVSLEGVLG